MADKYDEAFDRYDAGGDRHVFVNSDGVTPKWISYAQSMLEEKGINSEVGSFAELGIGEGPAYQNPTYGKTKEITMETVEILMPLLQLQGKLPSAGDVLLAGRKLKWKPVVN